MDRRLFVVLTFVFCSLLSLSFHVKANNVKIEGEPVVELNAAKNGLEINFTLSWDNSWRDEFNWDAVWVFVKYKYVDGTAEWSHLPLNDAHEVPADMVYESGKNSSQTVGVFVYRKGQGIGNLTNKKIKLSAPLGSITVADIENRRVYFAVSALEMVLVPYGAYNLGDMVSANSFPSIENVAYGLIPEENDILNLNSGYEYTASVTNTTYPASNVADHQNSIYPVGTWYASGNAPTWWKVDFRVPKTVKFFGVSGTVNYPTYVPVGSWFLEGSNDDVNWKVLSVIDQKLWQLNSVSYPVQQSIKVDKPGAYRYYRLFIAQGRNIRLQNIAMTEKDLYEGNSATRILIDSEIGLNLYGDVPTAVADAYPKGYNGFYCMKYELSQEQYVGFLNMLSYSQQKGLIGSKLDGLVRGDYIFGDKTKPDNRNGICVLKHNGTTLPAVFANNLNPAEPLSAPDDGQTLACNYMSPVSMTAYLDWAALRPLSEMEFEKACRKPYPYLTPEGDYAWNTTILNRVNTEGDLIGLATESEKPTDGNKNANAGNNLGPVRCGAFSGSNSTQQQSGATFYGIMEMSGNLNELCYKVSSGYATANGDGVINSDGIANVSTWPTGNSVFSLRGGSFASPDSCLRIADRSIISTGDMPDSTVTFRGVQTVIPAGNTLNAGTIVGQNGLVTDIVCPGTSFVIKSVSEAQWTTGPDMPITYLWYLKIGDAATFSLIPNQVGAALTYSDFKNTGSATVNYIFKRRAICPLGESETTVVTLSVPNTTFTLNPLSVNLNLCDVANASPVATPSQAGGLFEWSYKGEVLTTGISVSGSSSVYTPNRSNFGIYADAGGDAKVICSYVLNGCSGGQKELTVNIQSLICPSVMLDNDGNAYSVVRIGTQCWMGQNINTTRGHGGDITRYCYSGDPANCNVYGGMYTWYDAVKACPKGWHLPSNDEWSVMASCLKEDGGRLKEAGTVHWSSPNLGATNESGFNALPGGRYYAGSQSYLGARAYFWTSTENGPNSYVRYLVYNTTAVSSTAPVKDYYHSVRCVKD